MLIYPANDWRLINYRDANGFQTVVQHNPGNLITSPLSAGIVLAMAAFGARGNTEAQFRNVLHLPTSQSLATSGYQSLIDNLNVGISLNLLLLLI